MNALAKFSEQMIRRAAVRQESTGTCGIDAAPIRHISACTVDTTGNDNAVIDAQWPEVRYRGVKTGTKSN